MINICCEFICYNLILLCMLHVAFFFIFSLQDDLEEDVGSNQSPLQHELYLNQRKGSMETSPDLPVRPARHRKGRAWRHMNKSSVEEDLNDGKLLEEKEKNISPKKVSSRRGSISRTGTTSQVSCKSVGDVSAPNKIIMKENGLMSIERGSPKISKQSEVTLREISDSRSPPKSNNHISASARLFRVSEEEIVSFFDKEVQQLTGGLPSC